MDGFVKDMMELVRVSDSCCLSTFCVSRDHIDLEDHMIYILLFLPFFCLFINERLKNKLQR